MQVSERRLSALYAYYYCLWGERATERCSFSRQDLRYRVIPHLLTVFHRILSNVRARRPLRRACAIYFKAATGTKAIGNGAFWPVRAAHCSRSDRWDCGEPCWGCGETAPSRANSRPCCGAPSSHVSALFGLCSPPILLRQLSVASRTVMLGRLRGYEA